MCLRAVQKLSFVSYDTALREMLRSGLTLLEKDETQTAATFAETATLQQSTIDVDDGVDSMYSDLSLVTGGARAKMDIYHPAFWNQYILDTSSSDASQAIVTTDSHDTSGKRYGSDTTRNKSIHAFLSQRNHEISSSDSEQVDDESSILSDITGLTDVFDHESLGSTVVKKKKGRPSGGSCAPSSSSELCSSGGNSFASSAKRNARQVVDMSVRFGEVHVRHYERLMCDNPACRQGPGLGIGWVYEDAVSTSLDDWEDERSRVRRPVMAISRSKREEIIRSLGYTDRDIAATVRELNRIRNLRRQTVNNLRLEHIEMTLESARRNLKNVIVGSLRGKR